MKNWRVGYTDPVLFLRGIALRDYPKLTWVRLTTCRRHGHDMWVEQDYCHNCGAPWLRSR